MQAKEAISQRCSVRKFLPRPVPGKLLEELIAAARYAPTARNIQPWEFVAIAEKKTLKALGEIAENGRFLGACAACIAVFCQETKYYLEDGCAATENILIQAQDLGLASCWVAGDKKPYAEKIKELLKAPQGLKLVSLIALGYADESVCRPEKRPLKEIIHWESF